MRRLYFLVLVFVGLLGCAVNSDTVREEQNSQVFVNKKESVVNVESELFTLVSKPIATKYYDYKQKPLVRVFLGQFSSDIDDGGLVKSYMGYYLEDNFRNASQFKLADMLDDSVDCYIEGNIQSINKDKFRAIFEVYDNKSGRKVSNISKIYDYSQLEGPSYAVFKTKYTINADAKKKIGNTRMLIAINASGKSLDMYETTYKSTYRSSSEYSGSATGSYSDSDEYSANMNVDAQGKGSNQSEYAVQEKTGRVGAYPSEVQVFVNGKFYKPNSYGVAYDQNIYPGKYDIIVSFRETFWDSARSSEIKGKKHEKKFQVEVTKDKLTTINLTVAYDGKAAKIAPAITMQ